MPFKELYFHYGFNGKTIVSPLSYGDKDPIAEMAEKFKAKGDEESWDIFKRLFPKKRWYAPVIVRGEEGKGVRFWGFSKTLFKSLTDVIVDDEYGDITDPKAGTDIIIEVQTPEESGTTYGSVSARPKRQSSILSTDTEILEDIIENQPKYEDVFVAPSYDDLKVELDAFIENVNETETVSKNDDDNDTPEETKDKDDKIEDILSKFNNMT